MTLKVGILQTGNPPPPLGDRFGSYSAMVQELLGPQYEFTTFEVRNGELPAQAESCAAYVITGSASGVYDGDTWIGTLKDFVRDASGRAAMVGICFGHQVMAEAFGGRVIKSPKGWGIGLHRYDVHQRADWMDEAHSIAVPASHQDQIVKLPARTSTARRSPAGTSIQPMRHPVIEKYLENEAKTTASRDHCHADAAFGAEA